MASLDDAYDHVGVIGTTVLGRSPDPATPNPSLRRLLAALALDVAYGMTPEQLLRFLWQQEPPVTARQSLHNHVRRARHLLVDDAVRWDGRRYRLNLDRVTLDTRLLSSQLASAERCAAGQDPARALLHADEGLALWRGEPFADLDVPEVNAERVRLAEVRAGLLELRVRALLDLGRNASAISELERLVADDPHREGRWILLIQALQRAGRRNDALDAYQRARDRLRNDLGLEPSARLRAVQQQVLAGAGRSRAAPARTQDTTVVGRDALADEVVDAVTQASAVVLTGPAGIGKTALAARVVERLDAAGQHVVALSCADNPWTALQPVHQLLESVRGDLLRLEPPPGPAVMRVLDPASRSAPLDRGVAGDTVGLLEDLADALARVSEHLGGLVVAMDDADRCGPTTRRILLAAVDREAPIHLLLMSRERDDLGQLAERTAEIPVPGLEATAVQELIEREIGRHTEGGEFVSWIMGLTAGNPLFVRALLDDLRLRGALRTAQGGVQPPAAFDVPAKLLDVMKRRIAGLGLRTRRALDVAAVIGPEIDEGLLAEMTQIDDLHGALAAGMLEHRDSQLTFTHDLLHRAAYELVPPGRRVELHHTAAQLARERGDSPVTIARHSVAARELDPLAAAEAATDAGHASLAAQAYDEAADWFRGARSTLVAAGVDDEVGLLRLAVEAADARRLAGLPGHAQDLLDCAEAAVASGDSDLGRRAVLAVLELGETSETGEAGPAQQRAADLAERALARETDPAVVAAISAAASLVYSMVDEADRCRRLYEDAARTLANVPEDQQAATAVLVYPYAYLALGHPDDLERREDAALRLREAAGELDDGPGLFEAGHLTFSAALQRGDGAKLRATHAEMRTLLRRAGNAGRRWSYAYQEATLAALEGRFDDAERASEEALRIGAGVSADRALAVYGAQLLELRRLQGRLAELVPLFDELLADQPLVTAWGAAAALVFAHTDPDRSRQLFDELARDGFSGVARDFAWLAAAQTAGRAAVALGDPDRAHVAADALAAYEHVVCWQGSCTFGPVATTLAEIALLRGDGKRARAAATRGSEISRRLDALPYVEEAEVLLRTVD